MTVVGNGHAGVLQKMRGGLLTVRHRRAHLVLVLEAAHVALPFFFVAFVPSDGGETVEGTRGVRAWYDALVVLQRRHADRGT